MGHWAIRAIRAFRGHCAPGRGSVGDFDRRSGTRRPTARVTRSPAPPAPPPPAPPAPRATEGTSALAGIYQCQTLRYGTLVNGMYQTAYVPSALGTFEIDGDGGYRSPSYPSKGSGRVHADGATVTFEDGPYAGFIGELGSTSSGAHIRFGAKSSEAPPASTHFNDHVCYRKRG